jgi:hypothetical protein
VEANYPPIYVRIPLVSIGFIECDEKTEKLDIRGRNFRLIMWRVNASSIVELQEWLRFLVVRQRIPHSILGLPFEWEKIHDNRAGGPKIEFRKSKS